MVFLLKIIMQGICDVKYNGTIIWTYFFVRVKFDLQ